MRTIPDGGLCVGLQASRPVYWSRHTLRSARAVRMWWRRHMARFAASPWTASSAFVESLTAPIRAAGNRDAQRPIFSDQQCRLPAAKPSHMNSEGQPKSLTRLILDAFVLGVVVDRSLGGSPARFIVFASGDRRLLDILNCYPPGLSVHRCGKSADGDGRWAVSRSISAHLAR